MVHIGLCAKYVTPSQVIFQVSSVMSVFRLMIASLARFRRNRNVTLSDYDRGSDNMNGEASMNRASRVNHVRSDPKNNLLSLLRRQDLLPILVLDPLFHGL